jgi:hypothetical protein
MEEKEYWTETSRYKTLREFTFYPPNKLEVICQDVLYCSFGGHPDYLTSIDPDGGPYLCVGGKRNSYKIIKIVSHKFNEKNNKILKIVLEVIKIEN